MFWRNKQIPEEIEGIIETIEKNESQSTWRNPKEYSTGKKIIDGLFGKEQQELTDRTKGLNTHLVGYAVNVIPDGEDGKCCSTLIVGIGTNDRIKERILEAIVHATNRCRGVTKHIIFYAAWWDVSAWYEYRSDFNRNGIVVVLKMLGHQPIILD